MNIIKKLYYCKETCECNVCIEKTGENKMYNKTGKTVNVKLVGEDGNAFSIMGRVVNQMKKDKWSKEEIDDYLKQAKSDDYDTLLPVTVDYVDEGEDEVDEYPVV
jgi:hypothetical protein